MKKLFKKKIFFSLLTITICLINEDVIAQNDLGFYLDIYHKTIFDRPYIAPAYYAEYAVCGDIYCMFTEGRGYLHSSGYDAPVPRDNFAFLAEQIYKSDRDTLWHKTKEIIYTQAARYSYISDHQPGFNTLFSSIRRFEKRGLFNNQRNFAVEQIDSINPDWVSFEFTQVRRFDNVPYSGVIHFDNESGILKSVELDQAPYYSYKAGAWITASLTIDFIEYEGHIYMGKAGLTADHEGVTRRIFFKSDNPFEMNMEVSAEEYMYLSNQDINPFVRRLELDGQFQSSFSEIPLSDIRKHLEVEKTLEEQFVKNSNQPFSIAIEYDGTLHHRHGGQIIFDNASRILEQIIEVHTHTK